MQRLHVISVGWLDRYIAILGRVHIMIFERHESMASYNLLSTQV